MRYWIDPVDKMVYQSCNAVFFDVRLESRANGDIWKYSEYMNNNRINECVEISESEALGTDWRRDLAKPTTKEDCDLAWAKWLSPEFRVMTFTQWLARSREAWISQANSGRVGEPYKHAAAGSTPAPDTKPRDFLTWLASENKRAAVGELPPLQRAHVDAMLKRRQERERVDAEANHFHVNEICAALKRRLEKKK